MITDVTAGCASTKPTARCGSVRPASAASFDSSPTAASFAAFDGSDGSNLCDSMATRVLSLDVTSDGWVYRPDSHPADKGPQVSTPMPYFRAVGRTAPSTPRA